MSSYSTRTSTLSGQQAPRAGGKKIDTWVFHRPHPMDDLKNNPKSQVDVYLCSDISKGISFRLQGDALPPGEYTDTDLERLRHRARLAIEEQDQLLSGITWVPWLEVQTSLRAEHMSGRQHHEQVGRSLTITYRPLMRGIHPKDPNRALTINSNGCAVDFPVARTPDVVDEERRGPMIKANPDGPGTADDLVRSLNRHDSRDAGDTYAYLQDTPNNRAALDQILKGMEALGDKLHALLSPAQVAATVANIGQALPELPLLAHAPGEQAGGDELSPRGRRTGPRA
jgi:hypothetical protein